MYFKKKKRKAHPAPVSWGRSHYGEQIYGEDMGEKEKRSVSRAVEGVGIEESG